MQVCKARAASSVVSALASGARSPRPDPGRGEKKLRYANMLSYVSFAGMTVNDGVPSFGLGR